MSIVWLGKPASLFMAQATRLFRTLANQGLKPADICNNMNAELSGDDNVNGMFVTMFIGMLDMESGHLAYCNGTSCDILISTRPNRW